MKKIAVVILATITSMSAIDIGRKQETPKEPGERRYFEKLQKDAEYNAKAGNFFERSEKQKAFERFEYRYTPGNLNFFLSCDSLDPKLYGAGICQNAKKYSRQLQDVVAPLITGNQSLNQNDFSRISKHALTQCHLCAQLELKQRRGQSLGTVQAEDVLYLVWKYVQGDAKKFYENACGEIYKEVSNERLEHIIEVTQ